MRPGVAESARRFFTNRGIEVPAVTRDQMRELDRIAAEETGPNLFQMMENAGRNLAELAMRVLGAGWQEARIVVLAGSGGNGGGGICAARHLANRRAHVTVCLAAPDKLPEVPRWQLKSYRGTSGKEVPIEKLESIAADFILDAVIGYSLRAAPQGAAAEMIRWAGSIGVPVLALDVPSGVDSTTGHTEGEFMPARWTMTLALPKTGLVPEKTGELFLADIGIPEQAYQRLGIAYVSPFGREFCVPLHVC